MRFLLYILIALCVAFESMGQGKTPASSQTSPSEIYPLSIDEESPEISSITIEAEPDVLPQLNGGPTDFLHYVGNNMNYPEAAANAGVQGKVMVIATIGPDGNVLNANILQGVRPDIDAEALRLVREMPAWLPAEKNGKPVATRAVVMVPFILDKNPSLFK